MFLKSQVYNSSVVLLLTIYTFWTLRVMDAILLRTVRGYQSVDSFWLALIIFFVASHVFLHLFKVYRSKSYFLYYLGSLAIFFPLVLLAAILRVSFNLSEDGFLSYAAIYCQETQSAELNICGEAFAFAVYSMTIRSLPAVVTVPILYRWFYVNFPTIVKQLQNKG